MQENNSWEQKTINDMLAMTIKEQRARRRWGIFFKSIIIIYVVFLTFASMRGRDLASSVKHKPYTAVVNITGEIAAEKDSSAENIIPLLRKAFENSGAKAVMLRINSPGGAPVQTNEMLAEIRHLRAKYPEKKLYAVIEDVGASAAYMLACAADEIYADEASLVGSIGVLAESFGLVGAINKLGIERRLYTSGSNKAMLDPFSPVKPEQVAMLQTELDKIHQMFINLVKQSRGDRLHVTKDMFSGRIWIGAEAKEIGLIDGFGHPYSVARDVIGAPELVEYEVKQSLFSHLRGSMSGAMRDLFLTQRIL